MGLQQLGLTLSLRKARAQRILTTAKGTANRPDKWGPFGLRLFPLSRKGQVRSVARVVNGEMCF